MRNLALPLSLSMTRRSRPPNTEHPVALGSFRSWLRLLRASGGIDSRFLLRALFVSSSTLLTSPLRFYERIRWKETIERTTIHPSPVFIVGHWRTGTTYLHNLICQDDKLGYVNTFEAMAPGFCIVGEKRVKPLLARIMQATHPTRVIDSVPLSMDAPQEEEFAIANMSPHSFLHAFTYPWRATDFFERCVLLRDLSERNLAEWKTAYLVILRKATHRLGGKRLVLKNPANSGRIRKVRELFPDAKFIHMVRNPYDVFLSTMWLHKMVLPRSQLQTIDLDQIEAHVLRSYTRLLQAYLVDKASIPAGNLVEIRFEDLEADPLAELRLVYERLDLPGFPAAEPALRAYISSIADYRKNRYELDAETIAKVNTQWRFAFDEWGYPLR